MRDVVPFEGNPRAPRHDLGDTRRHLKILILESRICISLARARQKRDDAAGGAARDQGRRRLTAKKNLAVLQNLIHAPLARVARAAARTRLSAEV